MNKTEELVENKVFTTTIDTSSINLLGIRDYIINEGEVVEEDLDKKIYISYFRIGMFNFDRTLVGFLLDKNQLTISSYAKNNITNEKLVEK